MVRIGIDLVHLRGGTFLMGCDGGRDDERPARLVEVGPYHLGRTQVTNAAYDTFVAMTGHEAARFRHQVGFDSPDQPVVGVSWFDALAYCEWLSSELRLPFCLPSEAEWERAARGSLESARYPWGDVTPETRFGDVSLLWQSGPEPVGCHLSNDLGLFEMCENVHEWCADWYEKGRRASRGGSWRHQIKFSTCSQRSSIPPELRYADYGFRVAAEMG